jgi:hypothetical protein
VAGFRQIHLKHAAAMAPEIGGHHSMPLSQETISHSGGFQQGERPRINSERLRMLRQTVLLLHNTNGKTALHQKESGRQVRWPRPDNQHIGLQ